MRWILPGLLASLLAAGVATGAMIGYQGTIDTSVPEGLPRFHVWLRDETLNSGTVWSSATLDSIVQYTTLLNLSATRALTPYGKTNIEALLARSDSLRVVLYVRLMHTPWAPGPAGATPVQTGVGLMEWAEGNALYGRHLFQADGDTAVIWVSSPRNYYLTDWRATAEQSAWSDINTVQGMAFVDSLARYFRDYGPTRLTGVWWDYVNEDPNVWNGTSYAGGFDLDGDGSEADDYLSYNWGDALARDAYRRYMAWVLRQARRMHHGVNIVNGQWAVLDPTLWSHAVDGVNEEFGTIDGDSLDPLSYAETIVSKRLYDRHCLGNVPWCLGWCPDKLVWRGLGHSGSLQHFLQPSPLVGRRRSTSWKSTAGWPADLDRRRHLQIPDQRVHWRHHDRHFLEDHRNPRFLFVG